MASPHFCKNNGAAGFAMLELLIAIAILAAVCGFFAFADGQSQRFFSFASDRDAVLAALRYARAISMNSVCTGGGCTASRPHGVHFDPDKKEAVIFQGNDFSNRDGDFDETVALESRATYIDAPAPIDVVFASPSGDADSLTVVLRDNFGRRADILIGKSGRIDWR